MRNALHSPLSSVEPIRTEQAWAAPFVGVRWAESGGWHDASWNDLPLDVWSIQTVIFYTSDLVTDL